MNYPQAYLFLEPSAPALLPDDWQRRAGVDVYLEGASVASAELDERILDFKCVYAFLNPQCMVHPVRVLVCNTDRVGDLVALTVAGSIKTIYWITSKEHLQDIRHVRRCLDAHMQLILAIGQVSRIYSELQNHEHRSGASQPIDDARITSLMSIFEPATFAPAIKRLQAYVITATRQGLLSGQDVAKVQRIPKSQLIAKAA
jgi:hypothetical protein